MLSYCLKCRENTEKNPKVAKAKNGTILLLSKCAVRDSKKIKIYQTPRHQWIIKQFRNKNTFT